MVFTIRKRENSIPTLIQVLDSLPVLTAPHLAFQGIHNAKHKCQ